MTDINFTTIPVSLMTPGAYIEVDGTKAFLGVPAPRRRVVIIGQRLAAGTVAINTLTRVDTVDQAKAFFGAGSMLARMIALYKLNDAGSELWAVAINDLVGGAKASGTITITAQPTQSGTLHLRIGGRYYPVQVNAGDSLTTVAAAIVAAITADLDACWTASNAAGVVTVTAAHKGTLGNGIDLRYNHFQGEALPAGLALTIVAMSGGTGVADVTTALAAIGDEPFATVVHAFTDNTSLTAIEAFFATRFDGLHQNDGLGYTASVDTLGNLETLGLSRNSPFTVIAGIKGLPNPAWELAAATAAQAHASITVDPAQPFTGLIAKGLTAPKPIDRFNRQERDYALQDSISTFTVDDSGNVCIERLVTTYLTNAQGFVDPTFQSVNTLATLAYLRWSLRYTILTTFPRFKLGNDGTNYEPGQKIATPSSIKAAIIGLMKTWIASALVEDKLDDYKAALVVTRNKTDVNRIDAILSPDLVNQFLIFASQIQFKL